MPPSPLCSALQSSRFLSPLNRDCLGFYGLNREAQSSLRLHCTPGVTRLAADEQCSEARWQFQYPTRH